MAIRAKRLKAKEQLTDLQWDHLCGRPLPERNFEALVLEYDHDGITERLWRLHGEAVIAEHVEDHPGTRPPLWWDYEAPRQPVGAMPGWWCDGKLPEPRKRVGGTGTPAYECRAVMPSFSHGIPNVWVGIDSDDPPTFESQAAYLKRHGLLFAGEEKRSDFEPETVPKSWDWGI
jgi:hypothetical protein